MKNSIGVFFIVFLLFCSNIQAQTLPQLQQKLQNLHEKIQTLRQQISHEKVSTKQVIMKQKLLQLQKEMLKTFSSMMGGEFELGSQNAVRIQPSSF
jgi:hypothetical protein